MSLTICRPRTVLAPWGGFDALEDDLNRLVFGERRGEGGQAEWVPAMDVRELENEYVIEVDVPGMGAEDVHVTIEKGVLAVRGERKKENEVKEEGYCRIERTYGTFERTVALPELVDQEKTKATFKDGVLRIELPKREEAKPQRIDVKVE